MITDQRGSWRLRASIVGAWLVSLMVSVSPLIGLNWWSGLRNYFSNDQFSYAAIATNVSLGDYSLVEPFTQSGNSYYPSGWYFIVGTFAHFTGTPIYLAWTILGVILLLVAVSVVGWVAFRLSGWQWAPLLPALGLLTGTLSMLFYRNWHAWLDYHAVLWGPYGMLFTLNAEAAGISLLCIAVSLLVLSASKRPPERLSRTTLLLISAAIFGFIANVQTYIFFTGTLLVTLWCFFLAVQRSRSKLMTITTLVLVISVLLLGNRLASSIGPLPLFALLILAFAPMLLWWIRRTPRELLFGLALFALCASPQVIHTTLGLLSRNDFLVYRESSTSDLGVPLLAGIRAALPILVLACASLIMMRRFRPSNLSSLILALAFGGLLLSQNDHWGFNQEPYRFWIQYYALASVLVSIPLAWSIRAPQVPGIRKKLFFSFLILGVILYALGLPDFAGFWKAARSMGVVDTQTAQLTAIRNVSEHVHGLTIVGPCMDAQVVKLVTKKPIAYYNLGLAWPEDPALINPFRDPATRTVRDVPAIHASGASYVLTDSSCADAWIFDLSDGLSPEFRSSYDSGGSTGQVTLWRIN